MLTVTAVAHLRRHQDALLTLLDSGVTIVSGQAEQARAPSAATRWTIARTARAYQLFKHTEIFAPAIAHGTAEQARTATAMRTACLAMSADYDAYCRHWSGRDIAAEWNAYAEATRAIIARLRRHIAAERRDVERLLEGADRLRRA